MRKILIHVTSVNRTIVLQQGCGSVDSLATPFALRGEAVGRLMSYGAFKQALGDFVKSAIDGLPETKGAEVSIHSRRARDGLTHRRTNFNWRM
jgi:hypothetical protein